MRPLLDRRRSPVAARGDQRSPSRPVLLGTLSVRVDPTAERMAIDTALEVGTKLILANMVMLPPYPLTVRIAPEYVILPHEEDLDAVRATAARAPALPQGGQGGAARRAVPGVGGADGVAGSVAASG